MIQSNLSHEPRWYLAKWWVRVKPVLQKNDTEKWVSFSSVGGSEHDRC